MSYEELKGYMTEFRLGHITKTEMGMAIHMWQRSQEEFNK